MLVYCKFLKVKILVQYIFHSLIFPMWCLEETLYSVLSEIQTISDKDLKIIQENRKENCL